MPDPELDKRWGGGGEGRGRVDLLKIFLRPFGPQFGLEITGRRRGPPLDSALNVARTPQRSALNNVETILAHLSIH